MQSISTDVASVPVTMVHSLVHHGSEVVPVLQERPQPSARATSASFDNSGKLKPPPMSKGKVGFSGLGRLKLQMNGRIRLDWIMAGFRRTLPNANSLVSVVNLFPHSVHVAQ